MRRKSSIANASAHRISMAGGRWPRIAHAEGVKRMSSSSKKKAARARLAAVGDSAGIASYHRVSVARPCVRRPAACKYGDALCGKPASALVGWPKRNRRTIPRLARRACVARRGAHEALRGRGVSLQAAEIWPIVEARRMPSAIAPVYGGCACV